MAVSTHTFPHRLNRDGTYDYICTQCFMTVATADDESRLAVAEEAHICVGLDLDNLLHNPGRNRKL
jgi:hypothetical protein